MAGCNRIAAALSVTTVVLAIGCSVPEKRPAVPTFFPPPPAPPRIQYLTSLTGRSDIDPQSSFNRFVLGERADVKVDKAYGVAVHDGKVYVCDTNATVYVFDVRRRTFEMLKGAVGPGKLRQPLNISIEADGTKYVTDPIRGQVVVFDRDDAYVRAYGTPGKWRPLDAVPYEDRLYVAEADAGLVKVFDKKSGEMIKTIGDKGDPSERLDRPSNLAFDKEGYLYVTDFGRFQVIKFDRDGHFKSVFGKLGDNLGHFARPKGIAVDREGRLFAADGAFNVVQMFNPQGRLLMFFGNIGDKPGGLLLPSKVVVDYENVKYFEEYLEPGFQPEYLLVVTSQFGPRRVNFFAFGKQEGQEYLSDAELQKRMEERREREAGKAPGAEATPRPQPEASPK